MHLKATMEELENKFEELCEKIPDYETEAWDGICSLERAGFDAVERGQKSLQVTTTRLTQIDELITTAFQASQLSEKANARLMQILVSLRPRLENYVEQLKTLLANPPTESLYPPIDDSEIYPKQEEDQNNGNEQKVESSTENPIEQKENAEDKNDVKTEKDTQDEVNSIENSVSETVAENNENIAEKQDS